MRSGIRFCLSLCCALLLSLSVFAQNGLKIVVISGEDAVNVIQQGTAIAPIVEVRDRNDQPVAAAVVTFFVRNARSATFPGGGQTVTTVTDAAGRSTTSITPLGQGRFEIQVRAYYRGQSVTTRISQTNIASSAQGSGTQPRGNAGAQGAAAGAAGGGGGGALTAVIVGGVVAGGAAGAYYAAQELQKDDDTLELPRTFSINYTAQGSLVVSRTGFPSCSVPYSETGSIEITLTGVTDGLYAGTATQTESTSVTQTLCVFGPTAIPFGSGSPSANVSISGPVTGVAESLAFTVNRQVAGSTEIRFSGRLENETIVGTYSKRYVGPFAAGNPPASYEQRIDLDVPLTLR